MACYRTGGCGPYEMRSCNECPASKPEYANRNKSVSYKHIKCSCGGSIGCYDRSNFSCEQCGEKFDLYRIEYDHLMINDKTGWIFPVINNEE